TAPRRSVGSTSAHRQPAAGQGGGEPRRLESGVRLRLVVDAEPLGTMRRQCQASDVGAWFATLRAVVEPATIADGRVAEIALGGHSPCASQSIPAMAHS